MAAFTREKTPSSVGRYEILERLAATELSAVYKGRDPATGEHVAVKLASPATAGKPLLLKRFRQEFTIIKGLSHPHLIRALAFGTHADAPYMVLEYVDGTSLGDRIVREGRLPEPEAVRIVAQVAEALHYAHQRHVIHRDVKPDNVLLTADGEAKLADLGLAKDCDSEEHLTRPSSGLGTPNYMSPEQFSDAKHAGPRCDVYSLGATLYHAVTGEIPFRAKAYGYVLKKKLANDLVPPRQLVPGISPRVESAILRAADANPRARHPSCRHFLNDLTGRSSGGTPVVAVAGDVRPARPSKDAYERRATVRITSSQQGVCQPLRAGEGGRWDVTLQDVSADGVGVLLPRRFEPRTVLALELLATQEESARRLLVRVVRVAARPGRLWLHGCVFASRLADEEVESLA
jgi:serine/threonine protein kinase